MPETAPDRTGGRALVLCFDGTNDWVGAGETNVARLHAALDRDRTLGFYDGGVGTLTDPEALSPLSRHALWALDLASGTSLREKVLRGYAFLVEHHRPGDRIFLFGFSRGAYTARLVASMVHHFGLLRPESAHLAPYLWQTLTGAVRAEALAAVAARLSARFSRELPGGAPVEIEFMGLWDTVTSVGLFARFRRYLGADGTAATRRVLHAVSIEEERNMFPEALMRPDLHNLTEVWFPGVHRDCGGGLAPQRSRIADEALLWIATEAQAVGTLFGPDPAVLPEILLPRRDEKGELFPAVPNYPPVDPYVFAGFLPLRVFSKRASALRLSWPNWRHFRQIPENALVHPVLMDAIREGGPYARPRNLPQRYRLFSPGENHRNEPTYVVRRARMSLEDLTGIVLGVAILFLLWNALLPGTLGATVPLRDGPYGDSWPRGWGNAILVLSVLFVASQGLGQRVTARLPPALRPNLTGSFLLPALGVGLIVGILALVRDWPLARWGMGVGFAAWLAAQLPPLPVLRYQRVLPAFLIGAAISAGLVLVLALVSARRGIGVLHPPSVHAFVAVGVAYAFLTVLRDRVLLARSLRVDRVTETTPIPPSTTPLADDARRRVALADAEPSPARAEALEKPRANG